MQECVLCKQPLIHSEKCVFHFLFAAFPFSVFDLRVHSLRHNVHLVSLSKKLTGLQKGLVFGLWDDHPDVYKCGKTDAGKNDEAVSAQASL